VVEFEKTQQYARVPEVPQADPYAQAIDPCEGLFAGIFKAVNHQSACVRLQMERLPVKGTNLDAAAGRIFQRGDQLLVNDTLARG
jgi:hypothetical protein